MSKWFGEASCSFCGKNKSAVKVLIYGQGAYICNECNDVATDVVKEVTKNRVGSTKKDAELTPPKITWTPEALFKELSKTIVGQDEAKKTIASAIVEHSRRIKIRSSDKSNILLLGSTGTGKTALAKAAAQAVDVPFLVVDGTSFTPRGYIGDSVDTIIERLLRTTNGNVQSAESAIVFIDEFDKIFSNSKVTRGGADLQMALQYELLKLIEGASISVKLGKGESEKDYTVDTSKMLFICAGAFNGLERIVKESMGDCLTKGIGIAANLSSPSTKSQRKKPWQETISAEHLQSFGLIPELIGRLPIITYTHDLGVSALESILMHENSKLKYYQNILALDGVTLEFKKCFINEVIKEASEMKIGARALSSVVTRKLRDVMFEAFSHPGATIVISSKGHKIKASESKPILRAS